MNSREDGGGSDAKHNAVSEEERTAIMPTMWT